ncbi:DUF7079 family protein [Pseudomonas viridiflava]|uniref:DUF7079 family protein n=2 Tax=Pseudomonas viridiflava TaxID=33069 RepID=UPI000F075A6F|nr:hypothetical protein [Pseudomonas viridiflava]
MESKREQRRLWLALSDLFVDVEVDYKQVAQVAKDYAIEEVEFALFERVAPVCMSNMLTPAPPVWGGFSEEQLVEDIECLVNKRAIQGVLGRCQIAVGGCLIRLISSGVWAKLKLEIEMVRK